MNDLHLLAIMGGLAVSEPPRRRGIIRTPEEIKSRRKKKAVKKAKRKISQASRKRNRK